ncbi:MAG: DUF2330 domain-containing protein [Sandaracinaceae bacterium]|nr:DUF2330 domain-containing protein [Sandaracinaceae bacterium]
MLVRAAAILAAALAVVGPSRARAFAGFYAGRRAPVRAGESTVVLMRDGDRTVVSLRIAPGATDDLALVVPVPGPIDRSAVRTLRPDAFERIDRVSAPRLVEFWERDPCAPPPPETATTPRVFDNASRPPEASVEARFAESEYDVAIVRATSPDQLLGWLRREGYRAPDGLEAAVRPYADAGHRFLVARIDAARLRAEGPSPLRFHYRAPELTLPLRLGRLNASGPQELWVHVLARGTRYEAAHRDDVLVPTNLLMFPTARARFGEVYETIIDRVFQRHPDAVATEYAWPADRCDGCPAHALEETDLGTFGRDVIGGPATGFVHTRLHLRLRGDSDDLVLRPGHPIAAGRGRPAGYGRLSRRVDRRATANAFSTRYAILHGWTRPNRCAHPARGTWGAPPGGRRPPALTAPRAIPSPPLRLRRFLDTWAPVLRIPARGDAPRPDQVSAR